MLSQYRRTFLVPIVWSLVLMGAPTDAALGQEPVIKPTNTPSGTGDRLPLPRNVKAVQQPDGRIVVTWSPVPGATAYAITRSVPPDPPTAVTPNVTDTMFVERQVTAGKTYYYVISGVNSTATGMKAGASVKATQTFDISGSHLTPTNVVARYDSTSNTVYLSWASSADARSFHIYRSGVEVGRTNVRPGNFAMPAPAPGTRIQLHVRTQDNYGNMSPLAASNELVIPTTATASSDPSSGGPAAPSGPVSTTGPAGTIAVTIGSAITLRVGGSASAGSALGGASASRWVSLDDAIATVDGSGTVTARASGRARLLAIAGAADGSARVTLVHVTVTP